MIKRYTNTDLIYELHRFVKENNRIPISSDMNKADGYPSATTYKNYFGSWNNAMIAAELPINRANPKENRICTICGTNIIKRLSYDKNKNIICNRCHTNDRHFVQGILNPNSSTGIAIITEHVVYEVLDDCEKCNNNKNLHAPYDLISEKYGTINVKSAALLNSSGDKFNSLSWKFSKRKNAAIPDYYFCLGFNEDKTEILHVWVIPGNSKLIYKKGIHISLHNLKRVKEHEIDSTSYNKVYKNLDIYTLSEFCNLRKENIINTNIDIIDGENK